MYDAINKGLAKADGEILAYLNCDEQYLPGTLARVANFFREYPRTDILFGDALLLDDQGRALSYRRMTKPNRWHTRLCHLGTLSCAMFFRRRIWESGLKFPAEYRMIGDAIFVDSVLAGGFQTATLPELLATFAFTGFNQGQSEQADKESREWRRAWGGGSDLLAPLVSLHHRCAKFLAGAYQRRDLEYAIFRQDLSGKRRVYHSTGLGWHWPG
jgi:glycosyltransferase involved in cell wall biosynthesis